MHARSVPLYPVVLPGPTPAVAQSRRDRAQTEDCYQAMGSHRGDCQTAGLAPMQSTMPRPDHNPQPAGDRPESPAGISDPRVLEGQESVIYRLGQAGHMVTLYHENLNAEGSYGLHSPKNNGELKSGTESGRLRPSEGHTGWQEETPS